MSCRAARNIAVHSFFLDTFSSLDRDLLADAMPGGPAAAAARARLANVDRSIVVVELRGTRRSCGILSA